jgi:hypothetical protein
MSLPPTACESEKFCSSGSVFPGFNGKTQFDLVVRGRILQIEFLLDFRGSGGFNGLGGYLGLSPPHTQLSDASGLEIGLR